MSIAEANNRILSDHSDTVTGDSAADAGSRWGAKHFILASVVIAVLVYLHSQGQLTQENLKQFGAALPTWLFLPAYFVLPLFGFPISAMLLASGLKFGFAISVAIAAVGMAFHTFAAWQIAHSYFRHRLEHWLRSTRFELPTIPEKHQVWFTSLFVTVPGLPYAVKLYSLAMTNLSFRRYFVIVWLCHVANSVLFIGLGAAAGEVNSKLMIGLGALALTMILVTKSLRNRLEDSTDKPQASLETTCPCSKS